MPLREKSSLTCKTNVCAASALTQKLAAMPRAARPKWLAKAWLQAAADRLPLTSRLYFRLTLTIRL